MNEELTIDLDNNQASNFANWFALKYPILDKHFSKTTLEDFCVLIDFPTDHYVDGQDTAPILINLQDFIESHEFMHDLWIL